MPQNPIFLAGDAARDDGDEQRRGEVARGEERGVDGGFALSGLARGGRGRGEGADAGSLVSTVSTDEESSLAETRR